MTEPKTASPKPPPPNREAPQLWVLSAADGDALQRMQHNLRRHRQNHPNQAAADIAFTLQVGREHFDHRAFRVVPADPTASDRQKAEPNWLTAETPAQRPQLHWVCPPTLTLSDADWRRLIQAETDEPEAREPDRRELWAAIVTARRFRNWGLEPDAVMGYGEGVWAAGILSGVFSIETAGKLAAGQTVDLQLDAPERPLYLGYQGQRVEADQARNPAFWQHLARESSEQTVTGPLFHTPAIRCVFGDPAPRARLNGTAVKPTSLACFSTPGTVTDIDHHLITLLGKLYLAGIEPDWRRLHDQPRRRVPLPAYPFQGDRFWIEDEPPARQTPAEAETPPPRAPTATAMLDNILAKLTEAEAAFLLSLMQQKPPPEVTAPAAQEPTPTPAAQPARGNDPDLENLERRLVAICSRLLKLDQLDPHDNITRLGADSLFMLQLSKEVYERFDTGISPHHLFEEPTVNSLARKLTRMGVAAPSGGAP
ncbi:CurL C-terminal domain-containing protein [Acanthopleuribacter pedis]|uniref:Carrier domain-containing protein n=1 Tax=Acanthopleuribacter pedis TaxID=442870 RepID=A0A8J7QG22_9BACT|nr:phosphopantetheine-binding protein [Acanthopleuribacter pedis]MBO1319355.1 hypothetical protein [Acanthopleuribacter pedis]